jgi:hypothetical protein
MRTRIAILMAVIATFGAVVAYRAVIAEEETSSGERRLEQGQILELNRRADLLDTYRESAVFEDSENMARARGFYLQQQAENSRKTALTGSITANELDLQAEEQFAIARMYRQIREYAYVGINDNDTIETGISRNVARELADAGYGAKWVEPAKGETPDIWGELKADIATNRKKTVYLSGLVAVFVLALAFFTFTQLPKDGSALQRRLERVAIFIAVVASIACFVIDPHSWLPFLLAGLGIGVVALLGHLLYERPGVQQWLNGPKEVVIPEKERAAVEAWKLSLTPRRRSKRRPIATPRCKRLRRSKIWRRQRVLQLAKTWRQIPPRTGPRANRRGKKRKRSLRIRTKWGHASRSSARTFWLGIAPAR